MTVTRSLTSPTYPTYPTPAAFRQALDARLRSHAGARGTTLERERQLVVYDRFLARVGAALGERAVVKGGVVMELRLERARATRDIDLKWSGSADEVAAHVTKAAAHPLEDFFTFTAQPHRLPTIRAEGMTGAGVRFVVQGNIAAKAFGLPFGLDVAVGDPLVEEPELLAGLSTLSFIGLLPAQHRVYPRTSHVAEKLHAYTLPRARENSRVKDLPDMALLASTGAFEATTLRAALAATFQVRAQQALPPSLPPAPSSWTAPYAAMAAQDRLPWRTLSAVHEAAAAFLDPVLAGGSGRWSPERWAWSGGEASLSIIPEAVKQTTR